MKVWFPISLALLFAALTSDPFARPARVSQIPNGRVSGCATCHVNPAGGGERNAFGSAIENGFLNGTGASATVDWNADLAALDSDGDGATNGEELGDPDGDGVPIAGATVTNPGEPAPVDGGAAQVLSFAVAGQELVEDASNLPVDAGSQEAVIRFAEPVTFQLSEDGLPVFDNLSVGFAPYLGVGEEITNLAISEDGLTLTAMVSLAENTAYQVLFGPGEPGSFDAFQVYYVGTSELPDVSITGRAIYPADLADRAGAGLASVSLLDRALYESLQEGEQGFASRAEEAEAEAAALVRTTGIGQGGRYELKFVPDGDYVLLATVVLGGEAPAILAGGVGVDAPGSDPASLLVEGMSLTDVEFDLFAISIAIEREVTVVGVDVEEGFLYFDDSAGERVTVSVLLPVILDLEGNPIELSDLRTGSVVSVSGLMVAGEIVAVLIRVVSLPPSPDFSGDGVVGFEDFIAFVQVYDSVEGDGIYEARFDLSGDGRIGFEDFLIFAGSFGKEVGA